MLFFTTRRARQFIEETPFCSDCRSWLAVKQGARQLGPSNIHKLLPLLKQGKVEALEKALPAPPQDFVRLDVATCDLCRSIAFMSLVREQSQVGASGRLHSWKTVLARNIAITPEDATRLLG
jgi:hypothetical protein